MLQKVSSGDTISGCFCGCSSTCYKNDYETSKGRIDKRLRISTYALFPGGSQFLSKVAKHLLCIPATRGPSERVCSTAGDVVTNQRVSLLSENVDMLVF